MAIQAQIYSGFGLGGPQDLFMDNACGLNNHLCFIPQQQQKPHQEQHPIQRVLPFLPKSTFDDQQSMAFSQSVSAQMENQRIEIDQFINSQNERLRMALQEQRKRQTALFIKKYESKIQFLIKQKEEEMKRAANRTMELQDFLKRMEFENQTWQRIAKENESTVASLTSTIERLRETAASNAAAEDAESCCVVEDKQTEKWVQRSRKMVCRCCNFRNSCVIMLPCRHLCSCVDCEALLDSCPVCETVKEGSIEALF